MRDQHRAKQDLITEVVALRKQVADLRAEMSTRRRVEEALRHSEQQLRTMVDGSPAGLCLLSADGRPIAASAPFAHLLGYDSPAELLSVGAVIGVFADEDERVGVLHLIEGGEERVGDVWFRRKDGGPYACRIMAAACGEPAAVALVTLESLSVSCSDDTRSG